MCFNFTPPPRPEPNDFENEPFTRALLAYMLAFSRWHLVGTSEHDARHFLKTETERLAALDRARCDGLIVRG